MEPTEKKSVVAVVDRCGGFTSECVLDLGKEFSIRRANMQYIRVCYKVAKKKPSHLDMGAPTEEEMSEATTRGDIVAARTVVGDVTDGLNTFTSNPNGMKGEEPFDYTVTLCKRHTKSRFEELNPHFVVKITDNQRDILNPTVHELW